MESGEWGKEILAIVHLCCMSVASHFDLFPNNVAVITAFAILSMLGLLDFIPIIPCDFMFLVGWNEAEGHRNL